MKKAAAGVIIVGVILLAGFVPTTEVPCTGQYQDRETYRAPEPLQYIKLDSFTTEAVKDVRLHADMRGYGLPDRTMEWPDLAVCVVVQNSDDVPGALEVGYALTTANGAATER